MGADLTDRLWENNLEFCSKSANNGRVLISGLYSSRKETRVLVSAEVTRR